MPKRSFLAAGEAVSTTNLSRRTVLVSAAALSVPSFTATAIASPSPLAGLIKAHKAAHITLDRACPAIDSVLTGREPTKAAWRHWNRACRADDRALVAVCSYPCMTDAERRMKARYLLDYERRNQLEPEHTIALLRSMTGRT